MLRSHQVDYSVSEAIGDIAIIPVEDALVLFFAVFQHVPTFSVNHWSRWQVDPPSASFDVYRYFADYEMIGQRHFGEAAQSVAPQRAPVDQRKPGAVGG